jgi:GNAT superfamily N-acetyltransferase
MRSTGRRCRALDGSLFGVVAMAGQLAVGMGGLVGDCARYFPVQGVAVLPEHQGRGIGQAMAEALPAHVWEVVTATAFEG